MKSLVVVIVAVLGVAIALPRHRLVKRDSTPFEYELPSNYSYITGPITTGFDCSGRNFGYYADQANRCLIFHICQPEFDPLGNLATRMYSFICGEGTMFDQATLTCNYPQNSLPCDAAASYYNINDYFGRVDREFRDGLNNIF